MKTNNIKRSTSFIRIASFLVILSIISFGCKEDEPPVLDNMDEEIDDFILSLPPVQFEPEQAPSVDSTKTEQDLEYNYTIDYYSVAAGYDEQIVLNPQTDVIYPGALLKGESILDGSYIPINAVRKPITISTSLQGADSVSVVVEDPKLSTWREAANSLMKQDYDVPPANLGFTVESVYSKEHLALTLRASYDSGLGSVNGGFDYSNTKIKSRLVAKFIQNYYTLDLDLPGAPSDLIEDAGNPSSYGSLMPMYVSTVTFGRLALFTIESEFSDTEVRAFLDASYADVSGSSSADFETLKSKSTMKVYVLGGSAGDAGFTINGFEDFKKYITEGGSFSRESPGSPISYKLRYIHDNSIARVVFAASYPIRSAVPRTDNLRFDISVRLHSMTPKFSDGDGSANEFYGAILSVASNNPADFKYHWSVADGGTYLVIAKDTPHYFTDDIYTNRSYLDLVGDDKILISMAIKESDVSAFDPDDDLGSGVYEIPMIDVISSLPAPYTYNISNFGQGDSFMDLAFEVKVLNQRHIK